MGKETIDTFDKQDEKMITEWEVINSGIQDLFVNGDREIKPKAIKNWIEEIKGYETENGSIEDLNLKVKNVEVSDNEIEVFFAEEDNKIFMAFDIN